MEPRLLQIGLACVDTEASSKDVNPETRSTQMFDIIQLSGITARIIMFSKLFMNQSDCDKIDNNQTSSFAKRVLMIE